MALEKDLSILKALLYSSAGQSSLTHCSEFDSFKIRSPSYSPLLTTDSDDSDDSAESEEGWSDVPRCRLELSDLKNHLTYLSYPSDQMVCRDDIECSFGFFGYISRERSSGLKASPERLFVRVMQRFTELFKGVEFECDGEAFAIKFEGLSAIKCLNKVLSPTHALFALYQKWK